MKAFVLLWGGETGLLGREEGQHVSDSCFYTDKHFDGKMNEQSEADSPAEVACGGGAAEAAAAEIVQ